MATLPLTNLPMTRLLVVGGVACFTLVSGAQPGAWSAAGRGVTGGVRTHIVLPGETLGSIGARLGVGVAAILDDNQLHPGRVLVAGQTLRVDNRHVVPASVEAGVLVVNVPQRLLFHDDGIAITGLPVAVGRRTWPTPIRSFTIVAKEQNPTWDVPPSILEEARRAGRNLPASIPAGPDNPLGRFWLGLSSGGVGIHGTNAPSSIYGAVTHGCVRLHPDDIEWLFARVAVGTVVRTVYEPVLLTAWEDDVLLEAHPDVYRRAPGGLDTALALAAAAGVTDRVDWPAAAAVITARHGIARAVTRRQTTEVSP